MEIISSKELDFGHLKVIEKECRTTNGTFFHLLDLKGFFDGFQEGESGNIGYYLNEKLFPETTRVIFNMEELAFFADVAYSIVKKWRRILQTKGGDLLLASPQPKIAEVLDIVEHKYFSSLEEAEKAFNA